MALYTQRANAAGDRRSAGAAELTGGFPRQNALNFLFNLNSQQNNHVCVHTRTAKARVEVCPARLKALCQAVAWALARAWLSLWGRGPTPAPGSALEGGK